MLFIFVARSGKMVLSYGMARSGKMVLSCGMARSR